MSNQRILIVGGVAGGASCAARLRRMDENAEIMVYERGAYVSFANCGLPYYVGGVIPRREHLLVASPERFRDQLNVEVRVLHEVTAIHREEKAIEVQNVQTGEVFREAYDVLVLAPGAAPIRPPIEGAGLEGVFTLRNMTDVDRVHAWIEDREPSRAVVVGAGYIGLEMIENLHRRRLDVTVLEMAPQVMPPADPEMVTPIHDELRRQGVDLHLGDGVAAVEEGPGETLTVTSRSGGRFSADLVVLSVGVKPDVALARQAGLEIGSLGGIRVDEQMRTSDPSIFAVGDAVEVRDWVTGRWALVPLAGPAIRQARIAADVICGRDRRFRGTQGTAVVGLFGLTLAMTGASEKSLRAAGIPYEKAYTHSAHHAGYYPGAQMMALKLIYAPGTGQILGAQAVGGAGVDKRIDVLAMALQKGATVFDLEEAELCYAPQYGSSRDPVNVAGFVAANQLRGDVDAAHWDQWQQRVAAGDDLLVVDVRPASAFAAGSVPGAVNIPLGELRTRLDELPRDRDLWLHCGVGRTSYFAARILTQHGFRVRNLSGGITSYRAMPPSETPSRR